MSRAAPSREHQPDATRAASLATAIRRAGASASLAGLAVEASVAVAALGGSDGAAVVIWDGAGRPLESAVDGRRWGFPDVLDRAIHAAARPPAVRPVLRITGFEPRPDRGILAVSDVPGPEGGRGVVALLDASDADPGTGFVAGVGLDAYLAAVGAIAALLGDQGGAGRPFSDARAGLVVDARSERLRIARELHDGLIQSLYGTGLAIRAQAERREIPARGRAAMLGWVDRIDRVIAEARDYVGELEHADDAVEDLGAGLDAIAAGASLAGLDVSTEVTAGDLARPSADVRRELLRIANEAVSNAVRHSGARRVAIGVDLDTADQTARLVVEDNGCGFDTGAARPGGHGLANMASRAGALGGDLDVYSRPGSGTTVRASVPMSGRLASGGGS